MNSYLVLLENRELCGHAITAYIYPNENALEQCPPARKTLEKRPFSPYSMMNNWKRLFYFLIVKTTMSATIPPMMAKIQKIAQMTLTSFHQKYVFSSWASS